jgi:hypothetical protein
MKKTNLLFSALLIPGVAGAQILNSTSLSDLINSIISFAGKTIVPLMVSIALATFFWRIVVNMYKVGNSHEVAKEQRDVLVWGVVALFVMVSIWGLVKMTSGLVGNNKPVIPQLHKN